MAIVTKDLTLRPDGSLLLTVTEGHNKAVIPLDPNILLTAMKVDITMLTQMRRLADEAYTLMSAASLGAGVTEASRAWCKRYAQAKGNR